MQIDEVLIIRHQGGLYGINTDSIEHILKIQTITPIPLAPKVVRGLCSIEGSIMTVLDLSIMLLNEAFIDLELENARMISIHVEGLRYTVLTQEVITNIIINEKEIEYIDEESQRNDGVIAVYKYKDEIMQIIDLNRLIGDIEMKSYGTRSITDRFSGNEVEQYAEEERLRRYLLIRMAQELYAIDVHKIREVIAIPEVITHIADAKKEVLGMITLRNELITIVDLRMVYHLDTDRNDKNRIIIIHAQEKILGLLVDEIIDIFDFSLSEIELMPSNFSDEKISGITQYKKELVSIVNREVLDALVNEEARIDNDNVLTQVETNRDEAYLEIVSFKLDNNLYALYAHQVVEIIDNFEVTAVPDMPSMVQGVTNIRGKVIPVVSIYEKLDIENRKLNNQKIIVCQYGKNPIAVLVDEVRDVNEIAKSAFSPEEESPYFSDITTTEEGALILMLNLEALLAETEGIE